MKYLIFIFDIVRGLFKQSNFITSQASFILIVYKAQRVVSTDLEHSTSMKHANAGRICAAESERDQDPHACMSVERTCSIDDG